MGIVWLDIRKSARHVAASATPIFRSSKRGRADPLPGSPFATDSADVSNEMMDFQVNICVICANANDMEIMKRSNRYAAAALLTLVALGVGWYFGSPYWTLRQMRAAAENRDAKELSSYIDYPSLRASLKEQMKARIGTEMGKRAEGDPFGAIGTVFAANMVDALVDGLVTPTAMREVFTNDPPAHAESGIEVRAQDLEMERVGFSEFHLINRDDHNGSSLVFKRDGMGWKMTEIWFSAGT